MYATGSLCSPYCFSIAMLCRLFGKPDINKFSSEWLPLADAATNATIMNWAQILSNNLDAAILEYRRKRSIASRVYPPFFLSAYVMDAICFVPEFPIMGWRWTVQNPLPIQIYHKVLWESNFIPHFFKIYHGVILSIHKKIYSRDAPRFSQEPRWIFSSWQDGLGKNCSLISECLAALLYPMCYLITSQQTDG